jgi:hypothetical protein
MRGRRRALPAAVLALTLTACSSGDASDTEAVPSSAALPASSGAATTSPAAAPLDADAELNERGNIPKAIGEPAGLRSSVEPGSPLVLTFSVLDLEVNPPCNSGFEQAPATGNYLGITMRVETTPEYDPRSLRTFSEYDFRILGPDGVAVPDVIGNSETCLSADELINNRRFGPGAVYEGKLILDMPVRAGTLVYAPAGEPNGWEWEF